MLVLPPCPTTVILFLPLPTRAPSSLEMWNSARLSIAGRRAAVRATFALHAPTAIHTRASHSLLPQALPRLLLPRRSALLSHPPLLPPWQPRRCVAQRTEGHGPGWVTSERGSPNTETFRMYFHRQSDPSQYISPWHDIPLLSSSSPSPAPTSSSSPSSRLYHYVNEIPLHSTAKMEVSTKEPHNPIAQDIKKGKLRHFTYGSIPFNYGCLPQTWEDPTVVHPDTQCLGDNDPLDVVELSPTPLPIGSVSTVRLLGVLALIDEGETDWKLLALSTQHPRAAHVRSPEDVEREWPGLIERIRQWFRLYKTTDGKPVNVLAYDGRVLGVREAEAVVHETHGYWKRLAEGKVEHKGLWLKEGKVMGAKSRQQ